MTPEPTTEELVRLMSRRALLEAGRLQAEADRARAAQVRAELAELAKAQRRPI